VDLYTVIQLHVVHVVRSVADLSTLLSTMCDILTSVETTVSPKTTSVGKALPTNLTFVRHPRMDALDVFGETALLREALIAVTAAVWHFSRVSPLMAFHVKITVSAVITHLTLESALFSRVRPLMVFHAIIKISTVTTHFTLVSGLSADVTVLDMTLQPLLSHTLVGGVVAAQSATSRCRGRGAGSAERLLALRRRRLLGALSRLDLELHFDRERVLIA